MEPIEGHTYRIRFVSGAHAVYTLMKVNDCCWAMGDKNGLLIHVNPKTFETIRDITGDSNYNMSVGE